MEEVRVSCCYVKNIELNVESNVGVSAISLLTLQDDNIEEYYKQDIVTKI